MNSVERQRLFDEIEDDKIHHVYPTFGREHVTEIRRYDCWCEPKVEFVAEGALIIHEAEQ